MKLTDVVKRFSGEAGEDIEQWLNRFDVAITLVEKPADENSKKAVMAQFVPLLLEEPAYSTWEQLSTSEKDNYEAVAAALRRVFGKTITAAWNELKELQYFPGEPVDVLVTKIQRLLKIVARGSSVPEQLASTFLLDALPARVSEQIRLQHGEEMRLEKVASCAKALLSDPEQSRGIAATASRPQRVGSAATTSSLKCHGCGRVGHLRRNCRIVCFGCQERGHLRRNCPAAVSGNGSAEASAPDRAAPALSQ